MCAPQRLHRERLSMPGSMWLRVSRHLIRFHMRCFIVSVLQFPDNPQAAPKASLLSIRLAHLLGPFGALEVSGWAEQVGRLGWAVFEPSLHLTNSQTRLIQPRRNTACVSSDAMMEA